MAVTKITPVARFITGEFSGATVPRERSQAQWVDDALENRAALFDTVNAIIDEIEGLGTTRTQALTDLRNQILGAVTEDADTLQELVALIETKIADVVGTAPEQANTLGELYSLVVQDSTLTRYIDRLWIRFQAFATTALSGVTLGKFFDADGNEYGEGDWTFEDGVIPSSFQAMPGNQAKTYKLKFAGTGTANGISRVEWTANSVRFTSMTLTFLDGISSITLGVRPGEDFSPITFDPPQAFTSFRSDQSPIGLYRGVFLENTAYNAGEMVKVTGGGLFIAKDAIAPTTDIPVDGPLWEPVDPPTSGTFIDEFPTYSQIDAPDAQENDWLTVTTTEGDKPKGAYSLENGVWTLLFSTDTPAPSNAATQLDNAWRSPLNTDYATPGTVSFSQLDEWVRVRENFVIAPAGDIAIGSQVYVQSDKAIATPANIDGTTTFVWNIHSTQIVISAPDGFNFLAPDETQSATAVLQPGTLMGWSVFASGLLKQLPSGTVPDTVAAATTYTTNQAMGVEPVVRNSATATVSGTLLGETTSVLEPFYGWDVTITSTGEWVEYFVPGTTTAKTHQIYIKDWSPGARLTLAGVTDPSGGAFGRLWDLDTNTLGPNGDVPNDSVGSIVFGTPQERDGGRYLSFELQNTSNVLIRIGAYQADYGGFTGFPMSFTFGAVLPSYVKPSARLPAKRLEMVGEPYEPDVPVDIVPNKSIATDIDFRGADYLVVSWSDDNSANTQWARPWPVSMIDIHGMVDGGEFFIDNHDSSYQRWTFTTLASGTITPTEESGRQARIRRIWAAKWVLPEPEVLPNNYLPIQHFNITLADGFDFQVPGEYQGATGRAVDIGVAVPAGQYLASVTATNDAKVTHTRGGIISVYRALTDNPFPTQLTPVFAPNPDITTHVMGSGSGDFRAEVPMFKNDKAISAIGLTLRDSRDTQTARRIELKIPMAIIAMGSNRNDPRWGRWYEDYKMPDDSEYRLYIYTAPVESGNGDMAISFQTNHSGQQNVFGAFDDVILYYGC